MYLLRICKKKKIENSNGWKKLECTSTQNGRYMKPCIIIKVGSGGQIPHLWKNVSLVYLCQKVFKIHEISSLAKCILGQHLFKASNLAFMVHNLWIHLGVKLFRCFPLKNASSFFFKYQYLNQKTVHTELLIYIYENHAIIIFQKSIIIVTHQGWDSFYISYKHHKELMGWLYLFRVEFFILLIFNPGHVLLT